MVGVCTKGECSMIGMIIELTMLSVGMVSMILYNLVTFFSIINKTEWIEKMYESCFKRVKNTNKLTIWKMRSVLLLLCVLGIITYPSISGTFMGALCIILVYIQLIVTIVHYVKSVLRK